MLYISSTPGVCTPTDPKKEGLGRSSMAVTRIDNPFAPPILTSSGLWQVPN